MTGTTSRSQRPPSRRASGRSARERPSTSYGQSAMTSVAISPLERIHRFTDELRSRGVPVSMVERLDAMRAARIAELGRSDGLRTALRATLIKSGDHLAVFEEVFDLYFNPAGARPAALAGPA